MSAQLMRAQGEGLKQYVRAFCASNRAMDN